MFEIVTTTDRVSRIEICCPTRDREGNLLDDAQEWVKEAAALGTFIGGGASVSPVRGGWFDQNKGTVLWEDAFVVTVFATHDAVEAHREDLIEFCRRLLIEANQGEVLAVIDGVALRVRLQRVERSHEAV